MRLTRLAVLALTLLAAPLAAESQPALEQFRFEPPRLCLRDTFRLRGLLRSMVLP
jgi:hypothetical protein